MITDDEKFSKYTSETPVTPETPVSPVDLWDSQGFELTPETDLFTADETD
ncbi:MAG: hypothetical protein KAX39_05940 [candidate division Zixibacteria bacterium]|nr:hypothetical protein [candidate division Zixibacteria bacterium]